MHTDRYLNTASSHLPPQIRHYVFGLLAKHWTMGIFGSMIGTKGVDVHRVYKEVLSCRLCHFVDLPHNSRTRQSRDKIRITTA